MLSAKMEIESNMLGIQSLPIEIILMVLNYNPVPDIIRFGCTCKRFNELVKSSRSLWKNALRNTINRTMCEEIEIKYEDGNWYDAVRNYYSLKSIIHARLIDMAGYYYNYDDEITLDDVKQFFYDSFSDGFTFFCTINILQELLEEGNKNGFMPVGPKPFTLTEMFYAKLAVRHLMHAYMAIKWTQAYVKVQLSPEVVINYFLQWVDPIKMHTDEEVIIAINSVIKLVETELSNIPPSSARSVEEMCATGKITESQTIAAVSHVIYKIKGMTSSPDKALKTLDIKEVIAIGSGHDVAIAAIYCAVAKHFGVKCQLIAFPNHLFLEVRSSQPNNRNVYKIDLKSGNLSLKGSCPFTRNNPFPDNYAYCPVTLLEYLIFTYAMPFRSYKTWYMQNAYYLMDFLRSNTDSVNKYKEYLPYLTTNSLLHSLTSPIHIRRLNQEDLTIIALLSDLTKTHDAERNELMVKKRSGELKFAVGMIVRLQESGEFHVIRGWEVTPKDKPLPGPAARTYAFGLSRPCYIVVATDQAGRYVAQNEIFAVSRPTRLPHLEDAIARDFTHFNGFAYEPNTHKRVEYPDDMAASDRYRTWGEQIPTLPDALHE